jgi:hypothetical protein
MPWRRERLSPWTVLNRLCRSIRTLTSFNFTSRHFTIKTVVLSRNRGSPFCEGLTFELQMTTKAILIPFE